MKWKKLMEPFRKEVRKSRKRINILEEDSWDVAEEILMARKRK